MDAKCLKTSLFLGEKTQLDHSEKLDLPRKCQRQELQPPANRWAAVSLHLSGSAELQRASGYDLHNSQLNVAECCYYPKRICM